VSSLVRNGQRSLRVPAENNRFLCWPVASQSKQLLAGNRAIFSGSILPGWFVNLRTGAREESINAARQYLSEYAPFLAETLSEWESDGGTLVVGGHQPELFHPGVWFKNFLIASLARENHAIGLHVIIDHDVARSDALRIPYRKTDFDRQVAQVEYFQESTSLPMRLDTQARMPWQSTLTQYSHADDWATTIHHVSQALSTCGIDDPILVHRKDLLYKCIAECRDFGQAFSRFRHTIEIENGIRNLEVPMGRLCQASSFGVFTHYCLTHADSLWETYNTCRVQYRERHAIRNQVQPVLELHRSGKCLELPFWIYRSQGETSVERQRLWLLTEDSEMFKLCDSPIEAERSISVVLPRQESGLAEAWAKMEANGICIRPRALMTTLYLRCFVADLFVHGIGGGVYDELTDSIIEGWLGLEAPAYVIGSASLHLHFEDSKRTSNAADRQSNLRELQLIRSVPERFLDLGNDADRALYQEHTQLLASIPEKGQKRQWHEQITMARHRIESAIADRRRAALMRQEALMTRMHQDRIRSSREYAFVLFPERDVVSRLTALSNEAVSGRSTRP